MSKKHYIITAITLGAIAAASAALIGVTNLVTKDRIYANEQKKIQSGIVSIFGDSAFIFDDYDITEYKYANHVYRVTSSSSTPQYAVRTSGSNMYGKITLLVGVKKYEEMKEGLFSFGLVSIFVVADEQTYASTLEDDYVALVNNDERDYTDVSCGATYGAKLIRDMVDEVLFVAESELIEEE